jgi:two-component system sensor histidine kinase HydH
MQALGITITLNSFIKNTSIEKLKVEGSAIMSEILLDERWKGVAFIALYDKEGNIILHSNSGLIGQRFEEIKRFFSKNSPYYHRITLGTGEEVFISDTKITINETPYLLRVALHLYPAKSFMKISGIYLFFIFFSAFLILSGGILTAFVVGKIEKMQIKMKELENISNISRVLAHEIRNPLGSIKGFAQYLSKKNTDPSLNEYFDIIIKESLRIERLTDELSSYANPKKVNITDINLKDFLQEVILPFESQNKEIKFEIDAEDIKIKTDMDKLQQILANVIQNSVDAVSEKNQKIIYIKTDKSDGKIKIEIEDTGTGMDEITLKQALEPFFTTKSKGTGLGLAIVKRLCEVLKIDLQIKSKKGEGTKVCLTLKEFLY